MICFYKLIAALVIMLTVIFCFMGIVSAEIISSERLIQWDPGVRTDWSETRTTIYKTLRPSGDGDDSDDIEAAIEACPEDQVVALGPGIFELNSGIEWGDNSNVTLRGSGPGVTILKVTGSFDDVFGISNNMNDWSSGAVNLVSGTTKGSETIETDTNHGWRDGDYILIDQLNDPSASPPFDDLGYYGECNWCSREEGERLKGQLVKVTSVDNKTVGIAPPLYQDYDLARNPQGVQSLGIVEGISVESMTIDNTSGGAVRHFGLFFVFNSLFYDLELDSLKAGSKSRGFWFYGTLWNTVRQCTIKNALSDQTDQGYGIFLGLGSSANAIENNIFHRLILAVAFEGSNAGNVFAYNYTKDSLWFDNSNRLMVLGHGGGSAWNLIEGNYIEGRFRSDAGFGTQNNFTLFRNRIEQQENKDDQLQVVDLEVYQQYFNIVGNVLGTSGYETVYEHENDDNADSNIKTIYRLGYEDPYDSNASGNDGNVKATLLRHGNWDSVSNATVWDDRIVDRNLPPSLYLTEKPKWWGKTLAWPAIGPDRDPMHGQFPAKVLFENGSYDPIGISAPTELKVY